MPESYLSALQILVIVGGVAFWMYMIINWKRVPPEQIEQEINESRESDPWP